MPDVTKVDGDSSPLKSTTQAEPAANEQRMLVDEGIGKIINAINKVTSQTTVRLDKQDISINDLRETLNAVKENSNVTLQVPDISKMSGANLKLLEEFRKENAECIELSEEQLQKLNYLSNHANVDVAEDFNKKFLQTPITRVNISDSIHGSKYVEPFLKDTGFTDNQKIFALTVLRDKVKELKSPSLEGLYSQIISNLSSRYPYICNWLLNDPKGKNPKSTEIFIEHNDIPNVIKILAESNPHLDSVILQNIDFSAPSTFNEMMGAIKNNSKIKDLQFNNVNLPDSKEAMPQLISVIQSNKNLETLNIDNAQFNDRAISQEDVVKLISSNKNITRYYGPHADTKEVKQALQQQRPNNAAYKEWKKGELVRLDLNIEEAKEYKKDLKIGYLSERPRYHWEKEHLELLNSDTELVKQGKANPELIESVKRRTEMYESDQNKKNELDQEYGTQKEEINKKIANLLKEKVEMVSEEIPDKSEKDQPKKYSVMQKLKESFGKSQKEPKVLSIPELDAALKFAIQEVKEGNKPVLEINGRISEEGLKHLAEEIKYLDHKVDFLVVYPACHDKNSQGMKALEEAVLKNKNIKHYIVPTGKGEVYASLNEDREAAKQKPQAEQTKVAKQSMKEAAEDMTTKLDAKLQKQDKGHNSDLVEQARAGAQEVMQDYQQRARRKSISGPMVQVGDVNGTDIGNGAKPRRNSVSGPDMGGRGT